MTREQFEEATLRAFGPIAFPELGAMLAYVPRRERLKTKGLVPCEATALHLPTPSESALAT